MKKILSSILLAFAATATFAQCVPTTGLTGGGFAFLPTQLDPVYTCNECGDQEVVISIKTFADTTLAVEISPGNPPLDVTVFLDLFRLDSIAGLPAGLTYTTNSAFDTTFDAVENPFGYWINPGDTTNGFTSTTGCISINGTAADWTSAVNGGPNNDGIYPLTIFMDARAANFYPAAIGGMVGFNTWLTDMGVLLDAFGDPNFTVNGVRYQGPTLQVVQSGLGIASESELNFGKVSNHPNPFNGSTTVSFELKEAVSNVQFSVYDVLGNLVHAEKLASSKGTNTHVFSAEGLSSGIYVYTIADGANTITRKMNIR